MWRLGFSNLPRLKVFVNEFFTRLHLLGIHRVRFGHLGDEGVFQVDSMVKGASGWQLSFGGFVEDLCILLVLWGEFDFSFLGLLCECSG